MTHLCRVLFQIFNNETEYKIGFLADMFYVTVKFSRRKTETPICLWKHYTMERGLINEADNVRPTVSEYLDEKLRLKF